MSAPAVDLWAHDWFVAHRVSWLDVVEKTISLFGSTTTVVALTMLFAAGLVWRARELRHAMYLAMTTTVGCVVLFSAKLLVKRDRPPRGEWLVDGPGYSFPSGHALLSAALATAILVLAVRRVQQIRVWPAIVLGALFSLFIGVSRLYLGVHWLTDVLAGWAIGTLVALAGGVVLWRFCPPEEAPCLR
ncbi:phosphoesterase PA-phosphatase related protein [Segniliparus rotundus DSM 44985]|uniref:Phosphoesterase PA-phosphatase related protein n=1 Tax=Segniliparus rotundus (strain ATCC BAA-972 / CDC 1076 / CIP 108378 / DSM 44985 / JCM 13578) TaxID=640132 RepID=D6ZDM5_SEGRD|nr:phosphatase PAP2 family protein [Segniliparus rotundus]ADG99282.1 phosphoesterase PA-phosphatase related protein [Segniliparus rotundus DSM 44985]